MGAFGQNAQQPLLGLRDSVRPRDSYGVETMCARRLAQGGPDG
jgi:hypothetical protein